MPLRPGRQRTLQESQQARGTNSDNATATQSVNVAWNGYRELSTQGLTGVNEGAGNYVIYDASNAVRYTGQSDQVIARLAQHAANPAFQALGKLSWVCCDVPQPTTRDGIERFLANAYIPRGPGSVWPNVKPILVNLVP
jgi:hypothetical protein